MAKEIQNYPLNWQLCSISVNNIDELHFAASHGGCHGNSVNAVDIAGCIFWEEEKEKIGV